MARRPDPVKELDWSGERARELGEAVVGLWAELVERLPELPVNRDFESGSVKEALQLSVPEEPLGHDELVARLRELAFEQSMYPGHPGFLAYISGSGTVPGAAASMLAAGLNQNVGGWRLGSDAVRVLAVDERRRLHVDAAYGGPAVLAEDLKPLLAGIEHADSIALDPHKWLYTPLPAGCVLVRDMQQLADAFAAEASYIWRDEAANSGVQFAQMGPSFSRGFTAPGTWLSLLAHGRAAYGQRISRDAALARYLAELVEEAPDFELAAPVGLSVCCFRYAPEELRGDEPALNDLNQAVMTAIQTDGRSYCSNAVLDGRFCLRACVVNFRTEGQDMELLLNVAREHGARRLAGAGAG